MSALKPGTQIDSYGVLDRLPFLAVVVDDEGVVHQRRPDNWLTPGGPERFCTESIDLPVQVVWLPEVTQ